MWYGLTTPTICGTIHTGHPLIQVAGWNHKAVPLVDLDLDLAGAIGRKARPLHAEVVRELTPSDLGLLATERGIQPTHVQRITDRHHALARCLASGMSVTEACLVTGYTPSRVSILRGDPSFEELMAHYTEVNGELTLNYQQKAAIARNLATDIVIEKMSAELDRDGVGEEVVSAGMALDVAKTFADRTGEGPKSTQVNVNVNLGDRMKAARERASKSSPRGNQDGSAPILVIDGTFSEVKP